MHPSRTTAFSFKEIFKIAYPIVLGGVAANLVSVADTAFLSRLGDAALGGAGNAIILIFILITAGGGLATGLQIIIGRKNGEENFAEIGYFFNQAILNLLLLAAICVGFIWFILPTALPYIIESESVLEIISIYTKGRSWGLFFNFFNALVIGFYIGTTKTAIISLITFCIASINIVLDYVLIFGYLGFPEMGVAGAALASNISEICGSIIFFTATFKKSNINKYGLYKHFKWRAWIQKTILKIAGPVVIQNLIAVSGWFVFFLLIEKMGERPLAVSHIIRAIYIFLMIPVFALGSTANSLVSNLMGQQNFDFVKLVIFKILGLAIFLNLLLLPLIWQFDSTILSIFTSDSTLISDAVPTLKVVSFSMFSLSLGMIFFNSVSGTGKTNVALGIEVINMVFYYIYLYIAVSYFNPTVAEIWYSEFVYFGGLFLFSLLYFRFYPWKKTLLMSKQSLL